MTAVTGRQFEGQTCRNVDCSEENQGMCGICNMQTAGSGQGELVFARFQAVHKRTTLRFTYCD